MKSFSNQTKCKTIYLSLKKVNQLLRRFDHNGKVKNQL
ncbi:hypothetical protein LEP1GSC161_1950 [Leptospira santarosai str. CBC1416]|uniref:Uncharacterized protein n=3 Tax=Leptospira santarosai TaxID=28183 RepID=M6UEL6_9LEPT|nr:hypothetical protein LEP1GSC179_3754 [Leptospira santarosai str. MOR084]EKR91123.1 hypothetical protein LEP1GSC163_3483 [Leptospira santarosai str. CBC379]EMJ47840.1 hypothetical protein LEP1GSC169_2922 [Leptospira santarosai str. HAI1349]EMM85669.1 hypothetical protein LEP1GSC039_1601 [Leptospira santarosai str. 2000027870]EMO15908.1 hypothetical protein LEP1GSC165_2961 [Leptospira santarosai str. CBC523]EMO22138.1 hypothetical protein LEP1GSC168_2532 [Leptospira santarosai str. HAI134]EM